jgi:hypothetical protein
MHQLVIDNMKDYLQMLLLFGNFWLYCYYVKLKNQKAKGKSQKETIYFPVFLFLDFFGKPL